MKRSFLALAAFAAILVGQPAHANNKSVEIAIQSRPELSIFYEALVGTGVINELKEDTDYTVFAPTNDAFVQIDVRDYPCFYSVQCRVEVAAILRNHIIDDKYTIVELVKRGGNPASTIGKEDLYVEEPFRGKYEAEGRTVLSGGAETGGSVIFPIDGVILHDKELDQFKTLKTAAADTHASAHLIPGGSPLGIAPTPVPSEVER